MKHTAENRWKLATTVAVCLMIGLLAGCTTPPAQPGPPAVDRSAQPVSLAWSSKENLVSDIQVEEPLGLAIAYVERERKLTLVARELADGSLRWKREASVGHNPGGMRMTLPVFEHNGIRIAAFVEAVKGKSERWRSSTSLPGRTSRRALTLISWPTGPMNATGPGASKVTGNPENR